MSDKLSDKLSNVIGAPFSPYVINQLKVRSDQDSTSTRNDSQILYLANKTAWVRLVSSVDISPVTVVDKKGKKNSSFDFYKKLKNTDIKNTDIIDNYSLPDDLSKNWILEAGTSKYSSTNGIDLRYGLGPDGSYGLGGTKELGYRPMPGLTSVNIETAGRLGSLRFANIEFKVWNMNQLNIIEALYFRLGYSMLLEWGHTQYFDNNSNFQSSQDNIGISNLFQVNQNTTIIQQKIASLSKQKDGNYDGMLGIVSNFSWAFNQDGGYDCVLKLVGKGFILDSLKINQSYSIPSVLKAKYDETVEKRIEKEHSNDINSSPSSDITYIVPDNVWHLWTSFDNVLSNPSRNPSFDDFQKKIICFRPNYDYNSLDNDNLDYYYVVDSNRESNNPKILDYVGLFVASPKENSFSLIPQNKNASNAIKGVNKELYINPYELDNFVSHALTDNSLNPNVISQGPNALLLNYKKNGVWSDPNYLNLLTDKAFLIAVDNSILDAYPATSENDPIISTPFIPLNTISNSNKITSSFRVSISNVLVKAVSEERFNKDYTLDVEISWNSLPPPSSIKNNPSVLQEVLETAKNSLIESIPGISTSIKLITGAESKLGITPSREIPGTKYPTRKQIISALAEAIYGPQSQLVSAVGTSNNNNQTSVAIVETVNLLTLGNLELTQQSNTPFNGVEISGNTTFTSKTQILGNDENNKPVPLELKISFTFNNLRLIDSFPSNVFNSTSVIEAEKKNNYPQAKYDANQTNVEDFQQIESKEKFGSSLEFMLTYIRSKLLSENKGIEPVYSTSIKEDTAIMYNSGIFKNLISYIDNLKKQQNSTSFDLNYYGIKGFNSNLMIDSSIKVPSCDFDTLFTAYSVSYKHSGDLTSKDNPEPIYPVYITLGYLLAFLNNSCMIYENFNSNDSSGDYPYVYIDFNTETNLCLSSPQHLSIDPRVCLIGFNGTQEEFKSLFPNNNTNNINSNVNSHIENIFNPIIDDKVSSKIPKFQTNVRYRAKTMNILLNVDYLLSVCKNYISNDKENSLYLLQFLQTIMDDVSSATGNFNSFVVSYQDQSNTVQILDSQFVPPLDNEPTSINKNFFENKIFPQLPIFDKKSLVRSFEFKTDMSTKLSTVIAISARSDTDSSINSTDASSFTYLNRGFKDRYKPYITDSSKNTANNTTNQDNTYDKNQYVTQIINKNKAITTITKIQNSDQVSLQLFNSLVKQIYAGSTLDDSGIDSTKNYYKELISKIKSNDPITVSSPFIPANLEFSMDGIGGILKGQAFLIPNDRLPISLQDDYNSEYSKVGFIVTSLKNSIQNNEWITSIKGQMIRIRQNNNYGVLSEGNFQKNTSYLTSGFSGYTNWNSTVCPSTSPANAKQAIKSYLGRDLSNDEFNNLIAVVYAEAGQETSLEGAYVAGVILNRMKSKNKDLLSVISEKNQFAAVTAKGQTGRFKSGPDKNCTIVSGIYNTISKNLNSVPKNFQGFYSNVEKAFGSEENYLSHIQKFTKKNSIYGGEGKGWKIVGDSIFGVTSP